MRHGESESVQAKRFSGWEDVGLTAQGEAQSHRAGKVLARHKIEFARVYTSRLERADATLRIVLDHLNKPHTMITREWRLNERHYGALQGIDRKCAVDRYGAEHIIQWRRNYTARPPALSIESENHPRSQVKYADIPPEQLPSTESLRDAALRVEPWCKDVLLAELKADLNVLVVAHTASIRGITRVLEQLDDATTERFRIPTATPVVYELDASLENFRKYPLDKGLPEVWRRVKNRLKPVNKVAWK